MQEAIHHITFNDLWKLMEQIPDPEIPVLSITDLGIVRDIRRSDDRFEVVITPTYSGCPAMDMIGMHIRKKLDEAGLENATIKQRLSPAWTTDWMSKEAKDKLKAFGIAPPNPGKDIACPKCNSENIELVSRFGSTPCKALYRCLDCREPFDHFKCH